MKMQREKDILWQLEIVEFNPNARVVAKGAVHLLGRFGEILGSDDQHIEAITGAVFQKRRNAGAGMLNVGKVAGEQNRQDRQRARVELVVLNGFANHLYQLIPCQFVDLSRIYKGAQISLKIDVVPVVNYSEDY